MEKEGQIGLAELRLFHYLSATHARVPTHTHGHMRVFGWELLNTKNKKKISRMEKKGEMIEQPLF